MRQLKASIVRSLGADARFVDADSGGTVQDVFGMEAPIRVLDPPDELHPVIESDMIPLRKILRKKEEAQVRELSALFELADEVYALVMIGQGNDYLLSYYRTRLTQQRKDDWEERDTQRRASLGSWIYRGKLVRVEGWETCSRDEICTKVIHSVLSNEGMHEKLKSEITLMKQAEKLMKPTARVRIPEEVKFSVWRRDEGKCVTCGCRELIEFDHIIPLSRGGSNTVRNIQVLCERCNRTKSDTI